MQSTSLYKPPCVSFFNGQFDLQQVICMFIDAVSVNDHNIGRPRSLPFSGRGH